MLGAAGRNADLVRTAARRDRRWLARTQPLGSRAPRWAQRMYRRSLLVLRASVGPDGAVVAGGRPGWAYVWPRDAAAVAIALAAAGYRAEAQQIVRFLGGLDLDAAARFRGTALPVPGRGAQGDAAGWVAAARATHGLGPTKKGATRRGGAPPSVAKPRGESGLTWENLADYQEKNAGDYLGNALASSFLAGQRGASIARLFETRNGLVRIAGDPTSGLDSAAAWAVRPFALSVLYPAARRTLLRLVAAREGRYGLLPSEGWDGGDDPWTAPTAWTAWSLAALGERRAALALLGDLRRAATRRGLLPERVDTETGAPASTTPLAWSHAFAILALRTLWPGRAGD